MAVPEKPNKPTAVAADQTVTVGWEAPDDGGEPITGFTIALTPVSGTPIVETADAGDISLSFLMVPFGEWVATVVATNNEGDSPESDPSDPVTLEPAPDPEPEPDENVGVAPPDGTTLAGMVRILVGDTAPAPLGTPTPGLGQYAWYSDSELEVLGGLYGGSPKRVAIWVLSQVAISNALLLKRWTSEDLQVDGPAITRGIEATLKRLSAEVDKEEDLAFEEFFGVYGGTGRPRVLYPHGDTGWWC